MEKPILFNTEMVRAILDGRKTVTRRVIKPQPECVRGCADRKMYGSYNSVADDRTPYVFNAYIKPKYVKGDILWVRETWAVVRNGDMERPPQFAYKADNDYLVPFWKPSIHMPREAARIFLRVTDVRVERLKNMTSDSAMDEGFTDWNDAKRVWNSTIKPRDLPLYGWDENPWVWVIEFERLEDYKPNESNP